MTKFGALALVLACAFQAPAGAEEKPPLPLTLQEAQSLAVTTSPTLREYRAKSRESRFKVDEAFSQVYPSLALNAGYSRLTPTASFNLAGRDITFVAEHNYSVSATLKQALYTFGRLEWAAASSQLQERASQADLSYQEGRVVEDVSVAFFEALQNQEQVGVAEKNLQARQAHLRDARALVKAGGAALFDVKRDEAALASAEQALLDAQNRLEVSRVRLFLLLNQPQRSLQTPVEPLTAPPSPGLDYLDKRQDLAAARFAREAARARVELAAAADNPSLNFQSEYVQRNTVAFNPGQQWTVGLQLAIPLYDGGLTEAKTNQAKEVAEQLDSLYENAERQVKLEVQSLQLELHSRWKRIEVATRALESAREAARIARLRYQNGISANLEQLDAEAALQQAESDEIAARYQYRIALAHYRRAVAGGQP